MGDDENGGGRSGGLEGTDPEANDSVHLKRRVGLVSGVALIVGTMIGSGIFVSPSGLLVRTGSIGVSFLVWTTCGILSLCGALAYAELGTMNTSSGAEYAYFMDAFGAPPAFLFSWVSTLVLKPSQMAIICLSFAQYAVEAFAAECNPPQELVKLVAILAIVLILLVNCYSVNLATGVQNAFTAAKLIAILVVIVGGSYKLIQGNTQHLQGAFETMEDSTPVTIGRLATAFYTGLWAYDGWNNLNYVTEEIKDPSKNLPRSIMIGIPLVTICYALINVSYLAVMSPTEMIDSEAVAVVRLLRELFFIGNRQKKRSFLACGGIPRVPVENQITTLTRKVSQVSHTDFNDSLICCRASKNKTHVIFFNGGKTDLGGEIDP